MSAPPLLEIRRLTVARDRRRVLDRLDLDVDPGSIHALVGPNGAGKSTLLAAVLGRVEFRGAIRFHWRGRGRIGWVPQSFVADRTLPITVLDFLALARQRLPVALHVGRATRHRVDELLERVGLAGFARRQLSSLSGGELQRVLVANAIDPAPELLLLDEPASGLDTAATALLDDLLLGLARGGAGVLLVSHDDAQVRRLADVVTALAPDGASTARVSDERGTLGARLDAVGDGTRAAPSAASMPGSTPTPGRAS